MVSSKIIKHIEDSFNKAKKESSKLNDEVLDIKGLTSSKVKHFLNNICSIDDCRYFEIGVYEGSTFCSAIYKNNLNAMAIDNWSEQGIAPVREDIDWKVSDDPKSNFMKNAKKFRTNNKVRAYDKNCYDFNLGNFDYKVNVFFYDGSHDLFLQYNSLMYYNEIFDDTFILIVDDWNWQRNGIRQAIKDLKFNIVYEKEVFTSEEDLNDFWNGLGIFLLEK